MWQLKWASKLINLKTMSTFTKNTYFVLIMVTKLKDTNHNTVITYFFG